MSPRTTPSRTRSTSVYRFSTFEVPIERCQHLVVDLGDHPVGSVTTAAHATVATRPKRRVIKPSGHP